MVIEFRAYFKQQTRDDEDDGKLVLNYDAQQIDIINKIPCQQLLKVTIQPVEQTYREITEDDLGGE